MKELTKHKYYELAKTAIGLALIAATLGYLSVKYIELEEARIVLESEHKKTIDLYAEYYVKSARLERELAKLQEGNESLKGEVSVMTNIVEGLQKVVYTDKELLAKYSKVYFLNENYSPKELANIDSEYTYDKLKQYRFLSQAHPFLDRMLRDARANGLNLLAVSAFRSFKEQSGLKASYKVTYGTTAANKFSADQGYSEHQLGTAIDFTTPLVGASFKNFDKTAEYTWLMNNAHRFGFILSYPSGNAYYTYEPWHWRFVGVGLATDLHTQNKRFYDMDQRDINDYIVRIFEQQ